MNGIFSEIIWIIRKHYPLASLILFLGYIAEYGGLNEQLKNFLESGALLPLMVIGTMYFIVELFCQGEKRRKITKKLKTESLKIKLLYGANYGIAKYIIILSNIASIIFLSLFLFPWAYSLEIKKSVLEAKNIFDFYYVLLLIPAYDYYIFRIVLPKYLSEEKTWKEKSCFLDLLRIAWKNKIYSTLGLLILIDIILIFT